jgi:molybdenum cofactor cytidylyltransferase
VAGRVVGLLLAAGRGRRFAAASGPSSPDKLLAPVHGRPVAAAALGALAAGCDALIAVVRADAAGALREALAGARLVVCAEADLGMGHSLAAGARAAREDGADAVLVLPADMPWLGAATVRAIAAAARRGDPASRAARIVVPVLADGRAGHPVAFGAAHLPALARLAGDRGARALLDAHPVERIAVDDPGILRDVDTPSDLPPP